MKTLTKKIIPFLIAIIIIPIIVSLIYGQEPNKKELAEQTKKILTLIKKLHYDDITTQHEAAVELSNYGEDALPFIFEDMETNNAGIYSKVLSLIFARSGNLPPEEIKYSKNEIDMLLKKNKVAKKELRKIVRYKYLLAVSYYNKNDYKTALNIIKSMNTFTEFPDISQKFNKLKIICEEKILHSDVVQISISTNKKDIGYGDKIIINIKIDNMTDYNLIINSTKLNKNIGPIRFEVNLTEYSPIGNYTEFTNEIALEFPSELKIAPHYFWSQNYILDEKNFPAQTYPYRLYNIILKLRPQSIIYDKRKESIRELLSQRLKIRSFTLSPDEIKKKPIANLIKAIDKGSADDLFVATLLVPEKDKLTAASILVQSMLKAPKGEKVLYHIALSHLTNAKIPFDEKKWKKWLDKKVKEQDKK